MNNKLFVNAEFYVAGLQFHQYEEVKHEIRPNWILDLVPDPQNEYDPNAVKIMCGGIMLGFVPAKTGEARLISQALKNGAELAARVTENDTEAEKPWRQLKVWVKEMAKL